MKGKYYTIGFYVSDVHQESFRTYATSAKQALIDAVQNVKCDFYNQILVLRVE